MSNSENVQALWERIKKPKLSLGDLSSLLNDYQSVLTEVMASRDEYRALRRQQEELPDLQRLLGKKYDSVLQGRLQDGISAVKRKIAEVEAQPAEPETETPAPLGADVPVIGLQEGEEGSKPFRNMPTLGMD